ncbi:HEAT repeat domain-containing protein [Pseudochryseolinea flava]|uniref:Heme-binding protein n=1 Tax=Pseudochryseolinea flava TaxID=2059302 RepID=A0A364XZP4_9BACT|nr:HEAT repeat domain-containing protein [Pseudochryseolinea flava]RAV99253.1 heme-binding protein [Pseudochryseolinea flava]
MINFSKRTHFASLLLACAFLVFSCQQKEARVKNVKQFQPEKVAAMAKQVESVVSPQLAPGLTLRAWAVDSLMGDPVSIDIDDQGNLFYTRIIRQKHSEFDIRGHQDWEIESIKLQTIEDKRAFLHRVLSPENSEKNKWLGDLNKDGSHDWRDMTVEKEQVFRLEDTNGDGLADFSQLVIEDFHDEVTDAAGGIAKHEDDLFVAIGPDLWKLKDNDNDGVADEKTSLSHGYGIHVGFSGHGMSGVEVGPDGKIYWQIGDIGFNGVDADGKKWEHPNSGVIVRANPDGSDFEVFAYGNRNTHEFVFDEYGNMISEDNDGDHPGESERIVYVVNGADIGWRINWQFGKYRDPDNNTYKVWMDEKLYKPRWDGQAAYITPAIANYVNGPTGMLYNPGTAWGPEWKNHFFIAEFVGNPAQSGIHGFTLKPKGATFELGESKKVLGGVLATGMDWGPDGAMYVADWIDGWDTKDHGRIWKLDVDKPDTLLRSKVKAILNADFSDYGDDQLSELLKHDDMRVRQKSQFALAKRGDEGLKIFKANVAQTKHQLARVHAIWGISQLAQKNLEHAALLIPLLKDNDPEIRAQAARWIGEVRYAGAGDALTALLKDEYSRARFFAAEALGRTAYEKAITPLIDLLAANNDEDAYIRHAASLALARINKPEPLTALTTHASNAVRLGAVLALRRMQHEGIQNFLNDQNEYIVTEAARGINDDLSILPALPALGNLLKATKFNGEPLVRRAINANLRVGTDEAMQNLISYAAREDAPAAMRAEALAALSTWSKPSVVDRVDGRYRGEIKRDDGPVKSKSSAALITLSTNKDATVRLAAVKATGKLKIALASDKLLTILKTDKDARVREEALKSLAAIGATNIGDAIKAGLADKEKNVRVTALDLLPKMELAHDLMVSLLSQVINTKTVEEKQAALLTLGSLPAQHTTPVFEKLLVQLEQKKLPSEVQLELAEALDNVGNATLKTKLKDIISKSSTDTLAAAYAGALWGGDADKGGRIFYSHQTAQCIRCHSLGDHGGNAGPRLNGVANKLSREQLLQALIDPSARLAPGYGMVTLGLKNGKSVSAILQEETATTLRLKFGDKPDTVVTKTDISNRKNAMSSMPPMRLLLTKKEIRDVVAFIATLKDE